MAPRTAQARGAAAEAACLLLDLSHDEVSIVTHELCDPLRPLLAVHLSSTAKGLWVPMQEQLAELRQRHAEAAAFARFAGFQSCAALADADELELGAHPMHNRPLSIAHWRALGMLFGCGSLPKLVALSIIADDNGDEGVVSLADGLRRSRMPVLIAFQLLRAEIGPQGATALASALTKRALPSLEHLSLSANPLGDAGLATLLPALRQHPKLDTVHLAGTNISDESVASLVAQPTKLKSLENLYIGHNQITDAGCATLASALRGGALPALYRLDVQNNPASGEATDAVFASRSGLAEGYEESDDEAD